MVKTALLDEIMNQCSGFALYATPEALASEMITKVELPAMHRRQQRDATFFAGAIYRGYGFTDGASNHAASGVNLASPLGSGVDTSKDLSLSSPSRQSRSSARISGANGTAVRSRPIWRHEMTSRTTTRRWFTSFGPRR